MSGMTFQRARRSHARLRLAIVAVSGGGKTMGSLRVAKGLVEGLIDMGVIEGGLEGKIAMIDSERKSASLYADVCPFDTLELEPPYSVDRYQQAVDAAERAGYVVCIIDQISHAWAGPGGQLEYIDALKAQSRNAISPWAKVTPMQQEFYDRILRTPMHIIATMRAKSEYVIDDVVVDGRTKKVPRKIGLSPVQRDGIEYEFTTCLDVDLEAHMATASKDRTRLFMGRQTLLDEACGRKLAEWLQSGEATTVEAAPPAKPAGQEVASGGALAAGDERQKVLARLDDEVSDFELGFIECATLPDLAAHFDKAQKHVRGYVKALGAEAVKPFVDRVIAAKDTRKAKMAPPATVAESGGDLLAAANLDKISVEELKRLLSFAQNEGLTEEEACTALEVKALADLPAGAYTDATDKILKASRAKIAAAKPPAKGKRAERASA